MLGIVIIELLTNIISFHEFTKDKNSTVILLCHTRLLEYYLSKGFVILEHNSNNSSSVSNKSKQIIHAIDTHGSDYVMACYTKITSVANTIKKFHIMSYLHYGYIHDFYHDKQEIVYDLFCQYNKPLLRDINHPALIQE